jgi:hypothetical protein
MTANRWLLFLAALVGLGWPMAMSALAQSRQPSRPGGGVRGSVFVRAAAPGDDSRSNERITLPDFELVLKNVETGALAVTQKTDLFGRYNFPPQAPGRYRLVWQRQHGWDEGEHPNPVVVTSHAQYPIPVEIKPQPGLVVLTGRVQLADGGSPWYSNEFFNVHRFAEVELAGAAAVAGATRVRANFAGDYAVAGRPQPAARLTAASGAARAVYVMTHIDFLANNIPRRVNLRLDNRRPRLTEVVATSGGQAVRQAAPGTTVRLGARAADPDGDTLKYTWKVNAGTLVGSGDSVDWQLPPQPGAHVAYVLVSDGRGGDVQGQISLNVGAQGDAFTGRAVDQVGRPVARAEVAINGLRAVTDPNGFFRVVVEPADRYVLNINASGFAPLSRLFDRPSNGHTWKLVPAQVSQVNPANPIDLVDRRPILEQRDQKGAHVQVPAGSLVDASGNQPPGNLRATLATLDLSRDEAPGDWIAKDGASDAGLISYGLVVVEFTDSAGKIYNLAPGRTAEVTIPVPASMLAHAPPRMPIWTYDPRDGYWKSLGAVAALDRTVGSYRGQVPHFSTINMDQTGSVSCLQVHSDVSIPTGLTLRVSDVPGQGVDFATVKEVALDGPLNAVFRIPANSKVKLEVLDANGNLLPDAIVEDGDTRGTLGTPLLNNEVTAGPADPNLWPPFPYTNCKPVTLKLDALWAGYPSSPFLTFKQSGADLTSAQAYYAGVDPPDTAAGFPNGRRTTLADWWSVNGFDASGEASAGPDYARTSYLNNNDLGSGRDMHFLRHADGTLAAYVTNYSRLDATGNPGPFDQNPVFADDAAGKHLPGATVCMEYSPVEGDVSGTRIVKFFVYLNNARQTAADLDGFGPKFVPNLCLICHGGTYTFPATPVDVNLNSNFRELDLSTYKFPGLRTTPNGTEQAAFKKQNQFIRSTLAARQPILDLIDGWYAPGGTGAIQNDAYTPTNWKGNPQQGLYHNVVKVSCRTCHIAFDGNDDASGLDWNRYDQFKLNRDSIASIAVGAHLSTSGRSMPHSLVTYRNFWLDQNPAHRPKKLWEYIDLPDWPAIGAPLP